MGTKRNVYSQSAVCELLVLVRTLQVPVGHIGLKNRIVLRLYTLMFQLHACSHQSKKATIDAFLSSMCDDVIIYV